MKNLMPFCSTLMRPFPRPMGSMFSDWVDNTFHIDSQATAATVAQGALAAAPLIAMIPGICTATAAGVAGAAGAIAAGQGGLGATAPTKSTASTPVPVAQSQAVAAPIPTQMKVGEATNENSGGFFDSINMPLIASIAGISVLGGVALWKLAGSKRSASRA